MPTLPKPSVGVFRPAKLSRFSEAPGKYGSKPKTWFDCEMQTIAETNDEDLAEYLIGHSIKIPFPLEYWPGDQRIYSGEAFDATIKNPAFPDQLCLISLLHVIGCTTNTKLRRLKHDQTAAVPISAPCSGPDVSVRRALSIAFPQSITCSDLTKREGRAAKILHPHNRPAETIVKPVSGCRRLRLGVIPTTNSSALLTFATLAMLSTSQTTQRFTSVMHDYEPKTRREAMASANTSDWIKAEHIELQTVGKLGTFKIVDRPIHVAPIPSKFVYKNKRDREGNICQRKARVVARGDLQNECEYNNTDSPTSKFTTIRTIISTACQENMELFHWDIQGAFMTSTLDTEIFMELPSGYSLPEGKCILLKRSLYGLKQASALFHDTLEDWLLTYCFKAVGADGVIFRLD
eukprot:2330981-Rhodomonas_salina.1